MLIPHFNGKKELVVCLQTVDIGKGTVIDPACGALILLRGDQYSR